MRVSLVKYNLPLDRTEGVQAALDKAKANGGGTVYSPPADIRSRVRSLIPDHTCSRAKGWGGHAVVGRRTLQSRRRRRSRPGDGRGPKPPDMLYFRSGLRHRRPEHLLAAAYEQGIVADNRLRMHRVRVRVDHSWLPIETVREPCPHGPQLSGHRLPTFMPRAGPGVRLLRTDYQ